MIRNSTLKRYKPLPKQKKPIARKTPLKKATKPIERKTPIKKSSSPILKKALIKKQTAKESSIKKKLSLLKREIELEAVQNNEYYCKGCGKSYPGLDKSHILSVGQYKHLELVKENIQLMCRKDHKIWESGNIELMIKLNCFNDNLLFIKQHDLIAYNKLLTKLETITPNNSK